MCVCIWVDLSDFNFCVWNDKKIKERESRYQKSENMSLFQERVLIILLPYVAHIESWNPTRQLTGMLNILSFKYYFLIKRTMRFPQLHSCAQLMPFMTPADLLSLDLNSTVIKLYKLHDKCNQCKSYTCACSAQCLCLWLHFISNQHPTRVVAFNKA